MAHKSLSGPMSQAEYIRLKYLSGGSNADTADKLKKKKIKTTSKQQKIKILDEDIDFKKIKAGGDSSEDEIQFGTKEEMPVVAAVVDERPAHLKKKDVDRTKWKTIEPDDDDSQPLPIQTSANPDTSKSNLKRDRLRRDEDLSPPRKSHSQNYDSDLSPQRKPSNRTNRRGSDSDLSPPRKRDNQLSHHDSDLSPPRKSARPDSDSDLSPPRNSARPDPDSDLSPPRHASQARYGSSRNVREEKASGSKKLDVGRGRSSSSKHHKPMPGDDLSPRQSTSHHHSDDHHGDSKRSSHRHSPSSSRHPKSSGHHSSERHSRSHREEDRSKERHRDSYRDRQSPSPKIKSVKPMETKDKKMPTKTLSGKTAGLSDAKLLRAETEMAKKREAEMLAKLSDEVSGRGAKTVFRDKSGKIRDMEEEEKRKQKEEEEKAKAEAERLANIKKFSVGMAQTEEKEKRVQEMLHEMDKPLARYKDDEDLDKMLREKEIEDDPMLQYMRKQKAKKEAKEKGGPIRVKPKWTGPMAPPPNRFDIWPGFRWDGVDRSNGYEKRLFDKQAEKIAVQEEAYRWSTEDM